MPTHTIDCNERRRACSLAARLPTELTDAGRLEPDRYCRRRVSPVARQHYRFRTVGTLPDACLGQLVTPFPAPRSPIKCLSC
jgi:hypothetical protein